MNEYLVGLDLLLIFDCYLIATFIIGTMVRYGQYRSIIRLFRQMPNRWPKFFDLVQQQRYLFFKLPSLLPLVLLLVVSLLNILVYRFLWSGAAITPADFGAHGLLLGCVILAAVIMLMLDVYMIRCGATWDCEAVEKDCDRAEFWLTSWAAPAVTAATLGLMNPRRKVEEEVRHVLACSLESMKQSAWLWLVQIGFRLVFGFTLWSTWLQSETTP